ncbi:peptidoglycan-binding domain-containing protein [Leptolyngbya sp. UWPOB_LEPTO1]|uniref:peptidoglycan-binding domain-containing protein n=1 Tax=Leptolyngbya sp. UWPOB_LEPTO1 TaxID=2815653 RepID=UPI00338F53A5
MQLPTLKRGDAGCFVRQLQTQLMHWEVLSQQDVDGLFGPITESGVKKFQGMRSMKKCQYSPQGLNPTGVVG